MLDGNKNMTPDLQAKIRTVGTPVTPTNSFSSSLQSKIRPVTQVSSDTTQPEGDGMVMGMLKGLVSAPVTMIARPFQAVQSAYHNATMDWGNPEKAKALNDQAYQIARSIRNAPPEQQAALRAQVKALSDEAQSNLPKTEDLNWQPSSGGVIAAAPQNMADVKKDVGRAVQTVALGVGSPIAAGGAFGFGSSLEQGNDVFSMDTLQSTLLGMGAGKALDLVGKPLLNAAGKVIGKVTPQGLLDIASQGKGAMEKFMADNKLLNTITKPTAPLAKAITSGAESFDAAINKGASSLWKGTKGVVASQYPNATKESITQNWETNEVKRFTDPIRGKDPKYSNARKIINDSNLSVDDIESTFKDSKAYAAENTDGKVYQTRDKADEMTAATMGNGPSVLRPALREAEGSVKRVTMDELRNRIEDIVNSQKFSDFSPQQKADAARAMIREYGVGSPTDNVFGKNGYSLEDLYDAQLNANKTVYSQSGKTGITSIADSATAAQKKLEAEVFKSFLVERAPKELGIENYFKEQQKRFVAANVLRALDGRPIPKSLWQKTARAATRSAGAILGAELGGPFGAITGFNMGAVIDDEFMKATNPVKIAWLRDLKKPSAEAYDVMKDYISKKQFDRLWMKTPSLNAASNVDIGVSKVSNEYGAIPMGQSYTSGSKFANDIEQNARILGNTKALPAPAPSITLPGDKGPNYGGGLFQRSSAPYDRAVFEWKRSGTNETFEVWLKRVMGGNN